MATSGTFTGARGTSIYSPWLILDWARVQTDIPNNRSLIKLTLKLASDRNIIFSATKSGVIDGTSFSYTGNYNGPETRAIKTKEVWVNHDSDGGRTEAFSASLQLNITWSGEWLGGLSVSGNAVIDDIPRASTFTAFTLANPTLNTSTATTINYTIGSKSSAFSQDMVLKLGSKVIASWNTGTTATGALTRSLTAAEVNVIINSMANTTSGTVTLTMQTKSGTTRIGSAISRTDTVGLNSAIVPSSGTATNLITAIYGTGRDKTLNKYIQGISKVSVSFTGTAGYGASISSRTVTVKRQSDGANSQTISGPSGTTANPVTLSGTYVVTATVKDSRGRSASTSKTIVVNAYSAPKITKFTAVRGTPSTTVSLGITSSWTALGTSNPTTVKVTSIDSPKVVRTLYTLTGSTAGSLNATQLYTAQSDAYSYVYTISVTDSFGNNAQATVKVGTAFVEFTIAKGKGIGVGKVHERGALDVAGDVYMQGKVVVDTISMNDGVVVKEAIKAIKGDINGLGLSLGAGGFVIMGSGESADAMVAGLGWTGGVEQLVMSSDNSVYIATNLTNGFAERHSWTFSNGGNFIFPGAYSTYMDQYGNVRAPGDILTSTAWGILDEKGSRRVNIPLHSSKYADGTRVGIELGQFQFLSNQGEAGDSGSQSVMVFREFASTNKEFILCDDGTNGFYFNGDQALPAAGNLGTGNGHLFAAKYNVVSDIGAKEEFETYEESALEQIRNVKTRKYHHKMSKEKQARNKAKGIKRRKSFGIFAQDAPEVIKTDTGLGIDLYAMNTLLWKAIQELDEQMVFLDGKIKRR